MTVTTLPATRPATAPAHTGGALAVRPEQTMWSPQQEAVLRQSGISDAVTTAELAGFLHLCQRTGLDPFSRQIYLIGRWDKRAGREVFTPQTGIDGYRVVARRATAQTGGTYGYEDTMWCDTSGRWRDVWLADEPPAAAKVTVVRDGQQFSAVARFAEYVQTNRDGKALGLWGKMPSGQVAKCAEALALRKAFPHDLAGVYTAEEMAQADNPAPMHGPAAAVPAPMPEAAAAFASGDPEPQGRDYINEATEARDADTVRGIYREAADAGAPQEYLAQLVEIGKRKAAAEQGPTQPQQPTTAASGTTADAATAPATASPAPDQSDAAQSALAARQALARAAAIDDMYRAARDAGLTPAEADQAMQAAHGVLPVGATAEQIAAQTADLRAATQGGAQ